MNFSIAQITQGIANTSRFFTTPCLDVVGPCMCLLFFHVHAYISIYLHGTVRACILHTCVCVCIYVYLYICICIYMHCNTLHRTATHSRQSMCHTATHCITRQHTASHCNTLHHTSKHYNTLQRTATHCNTKQHSTTF